ncbi:MAG: GNAT family N-acetyltransferase [Hyphomicrobium sp.]
MSFSAPELLTAAHDVSRFDCGTPSLNIWLQQHALANQETRAARTFVVCTGKRVVGYYALAAGSVVHTEATGRLRRNMPDPVPMALLGRLAVDKSAQGFGIGAGLLKDAGLRVLQAADLLGIRGILVDALDDKAKGFYERFGFRPSTALPLKLMVTLQEIERSVKNQT